MIRTAAALRVPRLPWLPALLLAGAASAAPAPYASLEHYGLDEGLSQLTVTALAEDPAGFLWVGTQEGLNRFDGHRFEPPQSGDGDPASSSIEALAVDASARLWIGTNDAGLEVLDLPAGQRRVLGLASGLSHPTVTQVLVDGDHGAWLGTAAGIDRVDAGVTTVTALAQGGRVVGMVRAGDGHAYALDADCALWRLHRDRAEPVAAAAPARAPCVALAAAADGLWQAGAGSGLLLSATDGRALRRIDVPDTGPPGASVTALTLRADGSLLLGLSDGGLLQAPPSGHPLAPVATDTEIGSTVTLLHRSRSGVLWLGTHTNGLLRVRELAAAVRRELGDDAASAGWPGRSVRSIWRSDTDLVGTDSGLALRRGSGPWRTLEAIGATSVRVIRPAPAGGWWVGTHRGLWRIDAGGQARVLPGLPDEHVTDLLVEDDVLWVATRGGLARVQDGAVDDGGLPAVLRGQFLTALMRDAGGRLWIASNERGIWRLLPDGTVEHLDAAGGALVHDSVWALHEDERAWWIGTFSGGLQRIDRASGEIMVVDEADGLSNGVIYRIEPDRHGRLWLSTNEGLNVVDGDGRVLQTLLPADGLRNREFNSGASFVDDEGLIHFGGTAGLDVVDPQRLQPRSARAVPVIKGLRVLGRRGGGAMVPGGRFIDTVHAEQVPLDYRDSVLSLELVAIDFSAPRSARLRYRIGGAGSDWLSAGGPRAEVMLSYLPAGSHLLEVQAAGRDGNFGPTRSLVLQMPPPPWLHPAAFVGYFLLGLALLGWAAWRVRAGRRAERAQIELLNRTVAERTAELEQANRLLRESNVQLDAATRTDPLTQVSNRRDLHEWLDRDGPRIVAAAASGEAGRLFFCMIDLDDFKRINDHYGHQVGDQVLVRFAQTLREHCRQHDVIVRWGGEEFLLVLRGLSLEDATALVERVRAAVGSTPMDLPGGVHLALTCSTGFAPWPLSPNWPTLSDWDQSVVLADRALYAAKAAGKNAWVGLAPGESSDRACLLALLAGAAPESLEPGCVSVLHSAGIAPRFKRS